MRAGQRRDARVHASRRQQVCAGEEFGMWLEPSVLHGHSWELRQDMQRRHAERWQLSWYFEVRRDANYEPAWKRRRRS